MSHDQEHRADREAHQPGYLTGNDYALPHLSKFSREHKGKAKLLAHVNCCFLSTHGVPPTLLALKQHAQSLCHLIMMLQPIAYPVEIGSKARTRTQDLDDPNPRINPGNPFDWLEDLHRPYENDDPDHALQLTDLLNEVSTHNDITGTTYHCPLDTHQPRKQSTPRKPYASHANLLMHANECLERLDHEYSSTGGLLSLLPTSQDYDTAALRAARNSLLGQWLMNLQHLTGRMHELELAYGNATDALASEAVAPLQHLSAMGPDARGGGREIAYPQDRWVLVNAGDDVFNYLHGLFDRQEALLETKERVWREDGGVIGEKYWFEERGGRAYARGIVPINVTTRYYRLKGQGRNTIFVCPAWDHHPAVQATKDAENRPSLVSVVQPRFPLPATHFEKNYDEQINKSLDIRNEALKLGQEMQRKEHEITVLKQEREYNKAETSALHKVVGKDAQMLAAKVDALQGEVDALTAERQLLQEHMSKHEEEHGRRAAVVSRMMKELQKTQGELEKLKKGRS